MVYPDEPCTATLDGAYIYYGAVEPGSVEPCAACPWDVTCASTPRRD